MAFLLQMIHKTIFYLLSDQKEEADQMYRCDIEKEMSIESKDDKDEKITMFKHKVAEYVAVIMKLIKTITENHDKAADFIKHKEELTDLEKENPTTISDTIKDPHDAQAAVSYATQGFNEDKDEKITMFLDKVAEYFVTIMKLI